MTSRQEGEQSKKLDGVLKIRGTGVLRKNLKAFDDGKRIIVNQGGTGSSKTYSLCQLHIGLALKNAGGVMSIVRQTMPALRATAMRDFFTLLEQLNLYDARFHDKTNNTYRLHGTLIEFFGLDESQKVRGRKRNTLWINEANELSYEEFQQLNLRTSGTIFLDYNPSDFDHWIYDRLLPRDDCELIVSTYKDNPYLEPDKVLEIERLEKEDASMWRVFGLGLRAQRRSSIYSRYDLIDELPECEEYIWGLDFGFNNPTALIRCGFKDGEVYLDERLYKSHLTNAELIELIVREVPSNEMIYADPAEPQRIEEIARAGVLIRPALKGQDSVRKGIDTIKSMMVHITKQSVNLIKEWRSYSWKTDRSGVILEDPVKFDDHTCDAVRYAVYTHIKRPSLAILFEA